MPDRVKHSEMLTKTCSKLIIKRSELGKGTAPVSKITTLSRRKPETERIPWQEPVQSEQ